MDGAARGFVGDTGDMVYGVARFIMHPADMDSTRDSKERFHLAERSDARYELVEKVLDIGEDSDGFFSHV